jgi:predicted ATPase
VSRTKTAQCPRIGDCAISNRVFLRKLRLANILSFHDAELELRPLNVLIGPNASGKSNLIACLNLLRALPTDLNSAIARGGADSWINRREGAEGDLIAELSCQLSPRWTDFSIDYAFRFRAIQNALSIYGESLRSTSIRKSAGRAFVERTPSQIKLKGRPWSAIKCPV